MVGQTNKFFLWSLLSALGLLVAINLFLIFRSPNVHIAYVRSHDLINGYRGTLDARTEFEKKKSAMTANVDSLRANVERATASFRENGMTMPLRDRQNRAHELETLQQQYLQYSEAIENKIQEEDNKMMSAVLSQVNSFVESYAKEAKLNVVMGTTLSGSLLYGDQDLDITDALLRELNDHYQGK